MRCVNNKYASELQNVPKITDTSVTNESQCDTSNVTHVNFTTSKIRNLVECPIDVDLTYAVVSCNYRTGLVMIRRSEWRYLLAEFRWRCPSSRLTEMQSGSRQDNAAFIGCDVYHPLSVPLRFCCHAVDLLVYAFSEYPAVDWFSLSSRPHERLRTQQCSLIAMHVARCHAQDSVAYCTDFAVPNAMLLLFEVVHCRRLRSSTVVRPLSPVTTVICCPLPSFLAI